VDPSKTVAEISPESKTGDGIVLTGGAGGDFDCHRSDGATSNGNNPNPGWQIEAYYVSYDMNVVLDFVQGSGSIQTDAEFLLSADNLYPGFPPFFNATLVVEVDDFSVDGVLRNGVVLDPSFYVVDPVDGIGASGVNITYTTLDMAVDTSSSGLIVYTIMGTFSSLGEKDITFGYNSLNFEESSSSSTSMTILPNTPDFFPGSPDIAFSSYLSCEIETIPAQKSGTDVCNELGRECVFAGDATGTVITYCGNGQANAGFFANCCDTINSCNEVIIAPGLRGREACANVGLACTATTNSVGSSFLYCGTPDTNGDYQARCCDLPPTSCENIPFNFGLFAVNADDQQISSGDITCSALGKECVFAGKTNGVNFLYCSTPTTDEAYRARCCVAENHPTPSSSVSLNVGASRITQFSIQDGYSTFDSYPRLMGDVNGDGLDDIIGFFQASFGWVLSTGESFSTFFPGPAEFTPDNGGYSSFDLYPRLVGDVNGDGKDDIVGLGPNGIELAFSNGNGFDTPLNVGNFFTASTGYSTFNSYPRIMGDVNGDGMMDIVGFGPGETQVAYSTGSGFTTPVDVYPYYTATLGGWSSQDLVPRFMGDVNGDGLDDIVGFASTLVRVAYSTGSGFTPFKDFPAIGFANDNGFTSQDEFPRMVADVNGDGYDDIVGFGISIVVTSLSTGTGFASPVTIQSKYVSSMGYDSSNLRPRFLTDISGDGKADIIAFGVGDVQSALSQ